MTTKIPTLTFDKKGMHLTLTSSMLIGLLAYIGWDQMPIQAGEAVATKVELVEVKRTAEKNTNDVQKLKTDAGVVKANVKNIMETCNDLKRDSREQRAAISEIKTILIRMERNGH